MLAKALYVWFLCYGQKVSNTRFIVFETSYNWVANDDLARALIKVMGPQGVLSIEELEAQEEAAKAFLQLYEVE